MLTIDLLDLNRTAVLASVEVVAHLRVGDLGRATPCSEWTLAELLAHMTVQHNGFAAAARGAGGDPAVWRVRPLGADPVAEYTAAAHDVLAAFAADGVLDRELTLPEFRPVSTFPAARAIGFHLIDYVVHGWDVARSIGIPYELDPDLAEPALRIAMAVPNGGNRLEPGAAFAPALTNAAATPLDRILAALGRSPAWPATSGAPEAG
jgi:uncharacterized protein (TIGR03086 family)